MKKKIEQGEIRIYTYVVVVVVRINSEGLEVNARAAGVVELQWMDCFLNSHSLLNTLIPVELLSSSVILLNIIC